MRGTISSLVAMILMLAVIGCPTVQFPGPEFEEPAEFDHIRYAQGTDGYYHKKIDMIDVEYNPFDETEPIALWKEVWKHVKYTLSL